MAATDRDQVGGRQEAPAGNEEDERAVEEASDVPAANTFLVAAEMGEAQQQGERREEEVMGEGVTAENPGKTD